jgi:Fe-Mn family superoxide dismutase
MDCFEHAYWMDFGTGKASYIDTFFKLLDWDPIQRRAEQFGIMK